MSEKHLTDVRFDSFGFSPEIMQGIEDAGFNLCTPIQAEAMPIALDGQYVAGEAHTGTGKTAAFLLATMHRLLTREPRAGHKEGSPRAVILAPTRELAVQVGEEIAKSACVFDHLDPFRERWPDRSWQVCWVW